MLSIKHLALAAIASLAFSTEAFAAPININLTSPTSKTAPDSDPAYAGSLNYATPSLTLNVSGWTYGSVTTSNTVCDKWGRDRNGNQVCKKSHVETTTSPDNKAKTSLVGNFGSNYGIGVEKTSSPNHAVDNEGGYYDMLMLSFDSLVTLNSIDLGWISGDSDVSILAFNGTPSQVSPLGQSWESLLSDGWQSAGNYYNVGSSAKVVNPLNITSKYWLIGAYNINLDTNKNNDKTNDYFKLQSIKVTKSVKVPEPSAFFLFGLGLLGLVAVRRRSH
jgi:hypothetical protein